MESGHGLQECMEFPAPIISGQAGLTVRSFLRHGVFGTEYQIKAVSLDHRRAIDKSEAETVELEVGYAAPVFWRAGSPPDNPYNYVVANSRINSLQGKFRRVPGYEDAYRAAMEKNFCER